MQATEYVFTNLDKTLMTNVADRDPRLWVHLLSSYVISFVVWRVSPNATNLPCLQSQERGVQPALQQGSGLLAGL